MRHSVDAFFGYVQQHPFAWRMLFREPPREPDIAAAHARIMRSARAAIAELLALSPEWRTTSTLRQDHALEVLAEGIKAAINGLAAWWWDHRDLAREDVVDLAMDLLFVGIGRLRAPA